MAKSKDIQYKKVEALEKTIESRYLQDNNLIALYGEWGSGKSTVFKTLREKLSKEKYIPLIFETWKYEKDQNLPLSLYHFILDKIINDKDAFLKVLSENTGKALHSFTKGVTLNLGLFSINGSEVAKELEKKNLTSLYTISENFIDDFQKQIDKYIEWKKVIIFIDDLDRCEDENVITLISALKLLFCLKNIIFICGIDKNAVISSFETKFLGSNSKKEKAKTFLDKIFPIDFNLNVFKLDIISECDRDFPNLKLEILNKLNIRNPRKITNIFNKYLLLIDFLDLNIEKKDLEERIILRIKKIMIFISVICNQTHLFFKDNEWEESFILNKDKSIFFRIGMYKYSFRDQEVETLTLKRV